MSERLDLPVAVATLGVAVAMAMLAWVLLRVGLPSLARYRALFTERTHVGLREMFLFVDPAWLFVANLGLILFAALMAWLWSDALATALLVAASAAVGPRLLMRWMRRRRLDRLEAQLPDTLLMLAGGMRAGVSLTRGIAQMVLESRPPVSQEFDLVLREQRLGVSLDEALGNLGARVPLQSVTLAVAAMRIACETGGQLAETLECASQTLRSKQSMEGKIRALTAQGKLQAWVVGGLPMLLMAVLDRMEPAAMHLMFATRLGWATLAVIALLEVFGVLIIRRIVDIDV